jgi:hypothetical protein
MITDAILICIDCCVITKHDETYSKLRHEGWKNPYLLIRVGIDPNFSRSIDKNEKGLEVNFDRCPLSLLRMIFR